MPHLHNPARVLASLAIAAVLLVLGGAMLEWVAVGIASGWVW
jgi:hypothetical protein